MGLVGRGALAALIAAVGLGLYGTLVYELAPVVKIDDGQLQGRKAYSRGGQEYLAYLGIPYAQSPEGKLRFEAPLPAKPWSGVKRVTKYPPYCAQFDAIVLVRTMGVEDCLFLNVLTRDVKPKEKKPVLVWFHGGGFVQGSSVMYEPQYFMDQDIVLVTLNYRLGPLGFLNTGDNLIRGNMGMKDQRLALKWVQKNIAKFGGDPSAVTIFGESAGGASVQYHVISPGSHGLFQRAIAQSGSVLSPWAFMRDPKEVTFKYGKLLGCPTDNTSVLVDCLRTMDPLEMTKPQIAFGNPLSGFEILRPSIEGVLREDTFLAKSPRTLLREGNYPKVPLIMGVTSGEGGIRTARLEAMPELIPELGSDWEGKSPSLFFMAECPTNISNKVRDFYFSKGIPGDNLQEFMQQFTDMSSDGGFVEPIRRAALAHANHGGPTYLYYYDYVLKSFPAFYSVFRAVREDDWLIAEMKILPTAIWDWVKVHWLGYKNGPHAYGVTHADDLMQMWGTFGAIFSPKDLKFSQSYIQLLVDFASNEKTLKFKDVPWEPIKPGNMTPHYMLLQDEPRTIPEPFTKRVEFWEALLKEAELIMDLS